MTVNYKYLLGDSISGERIIGWAGQINPKKMVIKKGVRLKTLEFFLGAECIVNIPISINPAFDNTASVVEGLKGKKIYGEGEDYNRFRKVKRTSGHTHFETTLKNHAYCAINIPITSCR